MLDLKTILIVACATTSLQAAIWFLVWFAWRNVRELRILGFGFAAIACGLLLMIARGPEPTAWSIVLANTVIKLGLVLLADGLARFLGQPRYSWIGVSLMVFHVLVWSIAALVYPDNLALRIHSSTVFTVVIMSVMCLGLMRDRTQPTGLRWLTIVVLVEYMLASVIQSILEYQLPQDFLSAAVLADRNAWYFLQATLFAIALFICLLFMVSARLSNHLREKNLALSREIEERRRLEHQLSASLAGERALRDERADFLRVVSHEFRTPLAVIRNAVDMIDLVGGKSPEARQERIAGIHESLDRLFSLIDRFMANDRDAGFQPEWLRIGSLIEQVRLHFEMTGGADRLDFVVDDGAFPVFADPDMLSTVLINLIDNALKYSPQDQPVAIDVRSQASGLVIQVCDCGIGIPQDDLHKIGRRFYRASNTAAGTGTGLGLYTSRKLLAYHDGKLQLLANGAGGVTAIVTVCAVQTAGDLELSERLTA